jgi:hypothetical protein
VICENASAAYLGRPGKPLSFTVCIRTEVGVTSLRLMTWNGVLSSGMIINSLYRVSYGCNGRGVLFGKSCLFKIWERNECGEHCELALRKEYWLYWKMAWGWKERKIVNRTSISEYDGRACHVYSLLLRHIFLPSFLFSFIIAEKSKTERIFCTHYVTRPCRCGRRERDA